MGWIKNEPVYPKSSLQHVRSAEAWLQLGKMIKKGQSPAKVIKGSKSRMAPNEEKPDVALFGAWQVENFKPPTAINVMCINQSFVVKLHMMTF